MTVAVRTAERTDIPAFIRAHVDAWRVAYRGVIDQGYLDSSLLEEQRTTMWNQWSWVDRPGQHVYAAEVDGHTVGFGYIGPERAADGSDTGLGEVYAFYLHPDAWGSGAATHRPLRAGRRGASSGRSGRRPRVPS